MSVHSAAYVSVHSAAYMSVHSAAYMSVHSAAYMSVHSAAYMSVHSAAYISDILEIHNFVKNNNWLSIRHHGVVVKTMSNTFTVSLRCYITIFFNLENNQHK